MSKLNEISKKVESMKKELHKLRLEEQFKRSQINELKQEKVNLYQQGINKDRRNKQGLIINSEINELEEQIEEIILKKAKREIELEDNLKDDIQELKQERSERVKQVNERVQSMNDEIFEAKLEFLKKLHDLEQERQTMVEEVNEMSQLISYIDKKDRQPTIKGLDTSPSRYGVNTVSVTPTQFDIDAVFGKGKPSSTTTLYFKHGEVERDTLKANKRLRELDK